MIYFNEQDLKQVPFSWNSVARVVEKTLVTLAQKDYSQPLKPYLRYGDKKNRIIAMPAYVGGPFKVAGIKWIASFPDNIHRGLPRAHSVVVVNNAKTGVPEAIINTPLLSGIRTAAVSAVMLRAYIKTRKPKKLSVGILGFGPIGQRHLEMCREILGNRLNHAYLFDIRGVYSKKILSKNVSAVRSWQELYEKSDVIITCTVAKKPYITKKPKPGSLLLNVSLRDYGANIFSSVHRSIVVDDWEEVCRENTDVELMAKKCGLKERDVFRLQDVVLDSALKKIPRELPIMFNPMGMAVFDLSVASYFLKQAKLKKIGRSL